jgi:S-formylglutathione hydrolase FrmB
MPVHNYAQPRGTLVTLEVASPALADNLLGDPGARAVAVYLPEGYDRGDQDYPVFVDLAGYSSSGLKRLAWTGFGESMPQRLDRLVAEGKMGPVIGVFPDGFTALGGNQYIDSIALGRWEEFLCVDLVARLEREFRVRRGRAGRAIFGHSSGGYGALVHGMKHADVWGAVGCHAGDCNFDLAYRGDFPKVLPAIARHGGIEGYLRAFAAAPKWSGGDHMPLMLLAMAASYDPDPHAFMGVRLPVDLHTCELDPAAWARWLRHDPLTLIEDPHVQHNLRRLYGLFIDVGSRDQYNAQYGARALARRLDAHGVEHVYEEFPDEHNNTTYRLDVSLPYLYRALDGAGGR